MHFPLRYLEWILIYQGMLSFKETIELELHSFIYRNTTGQHAVAIESWSIIGPLISGNRYFTDLIATDC